MKHFFLFCLYFAAFGLSLFGQGWSDKHFRKVDRYANQTPNEMAVSLPLLANYLVKEFDNEEDKLRAIYIWIANHIKYDDTAFLHAHNFYVLNEGQENKQSAEVVLREKIGLCEGYANLLKALCRQVGIRAEIVIGYCKDEMGNLADIAHAWNVVEINKEWYMLDVTWGAGTLDAKNKRYVRKVNDTYFLPDKKLFLEDHFPLDPMWQLSEDLVNEANFSYEWNHQKPILTTFPAYKDSLQTWFSTDSATQRKITAYRALRYYPENTYVLFNAYIQAEAEVSANMVLLNEHLEQMKAAKEEARFTEKEMAESLAFFATHNQALHQKVDSLDAIFSRLENKLQGEEKLAFSMQHRQLRMPQVRVYQHYFQWYEHDFRLAEEKNNQFAQDTSILPFWKSLSQNNLYMYAAKKELENANLKDSKMRGLQHELSYDLLDMESQKTLILFDWLGQHLYPKNAAWLDSLQQQYTILNHLYEQLLVEGIGVNLTVKDSLLYAYFRKNIDVFALELADLALIMEKSKATHALDDLGKSLDWEEIGKIQQMMHLFDNYQAKADTFEKIWINTAKGKHIQALEPNVYETMLAQYQLDRLLIDYAKLRAQLAMNEVILGNAAKVTAQELTMNLTHSDEMLMALQTSQSYQKLLENDKKLSQELEQMSLLYLIQCLSAEAHFAWQTAASFVSKTDLLPADEEVLRGNYEKIAQCYQKLQPHFSLSSESKNTLAAYFAYYNIQTLADITALFYKAGLSQTVNGQLVRALTLMNNALIYIVEAEKWLKNLDELHNEELSVEVAELKSLLPKSKADILTAISELR